MDTSKYEYDLINAIADRAVSAFAKQDIEYSKVSAFMDIKRAHLCGPLKLDELRDADDVTFAHDVGGIRSHMDRSAVKSEGMVQTANLAVALYHASARVA